MRSNTTRGNATMRTASLPRHVLSVGVFSALGRPPPLCLAVVCGALLEPRNVGRWRLFERVTEHAEYAPSEDGEAWLV